MQITQLEELVDPVGFCNAPQPICKVASLFGLHLANGAQIEEGRLLAKRLIATDIAPLPLLAAVQQRTGSSLFVHLKNGLVTGVLGFFPVTDAGVALLDAGGFDARVMDLDIVPPPGVAPAATYAFGVAASTKAGGSAVIRGSAGIQEALLWGMPIYTRIATEDGARVLLGGLGFKPVANDPTLVRRPPRTRALEGFKAELTA